MEYNNLQLKVNDKLKHLELVIDGYTAFIDYKLVEQNLFLIHTEVPVELKGKGAGNAIVEKALHYAKENGYKIIPICPFVQAYLKRHSGWEDIISPDSERFIHP